MVILRNYRTINFDSIFNLSSGVTCNCFFLAGCCGNYRFKQLPNAFSINPLNAMHPYKIVTTVASNLVKSLPAGTGKYCIDQVEKFYTSKGVSEDSFELDPVCEEQVHKLQNGINSCKATGLDNIPAQFVTDASEINTSPLTHIINLSLSQGIMHNPLHKKTQ